MSQEVLNQPNNVVEDESAKTATVILKTGETVQVPFNILFDYLRENEHLIETQQG